MSKKIKTPKSAEAKLQGLESLAVLTAIEPEVDVVASVSDALQSLPEFAVLERATELQAEADTLYAEAKRILGNEKLDDLLARISSLQGKSMQFKAEVKNRVLASPGVTHVRATVLGKFGAWLEKQVTESIQKSPRYLQMAEELRKAVADAERVQELRLAVEAKEKEAQSLLDSIVISL